jgi:hypothetical protein
MGLKVAALRSHHLHTKFHPNLSTSSKVVGGGPQRHTHIHIHTYIHTHTQTGDLISLLSILESRLKL